jgi:hypothetical protein
VGSAAVTVGIINADGERISPPRKGENGPNIDNNGPKMAVSAPIPPTESPLAPKTEPNADDTPGRMLTAVEADLERMEQLDKGVRGSLAALARELARAMDASDDNQPTPAQIGQLGQQLRTTLLALDNVGGDAGTAEAFFRIMASAVGSTGDTGGDDDSSRDPVRVRRPRAVPVSGLPDGEGNAR